MLRYIIDYSRYRVAESIAELWIAGDSAAQIAEAYGLSPWAVELVVAAYDRKDKYEGHIEAIGEKDGAA